MNALTVKDMMVPLELYAAVSANATLSEAIIALTELRVNPNKRQYPHMSILVKDNNRKVIGKLSQLNVIMGLEQGYFKHGNFKKVMQSVFAPEGIKQQMGKYNL